MLGDLAEAGMLGGDERGTRVTLLTGSLSASARRKAILEAASGEAGIVVGTHALLAEKVQFADLGLIVVDEQHRFGVEQRDALRGKGKTVPHLLVMTATPIPRTVAMTVFGDLEISTLSELPAGRSPIATSVVPMQNQRWVNRAWQRVREEAEAGHQVFVVCPRIGDDGGAVPQGDEIANWDDEPDPEDGAAAPEDGEQKRPARAVIEELAVLRDLPQLSGLVIEPLHGRMSAEHRDETMRRFAAGAIHVLVATTVIEVGVDVPNASTMVVLDADRFGVSQLHQLRGRVGRGRAPGLCLLFTQGLDGPAAERLKAIAGTVDGFELARVDLENRREGDVLGNRQSGGRSSLRLLRVLRDEKLIETVRHEAIAVVESDPDLTGQPALLAALRVWLDDDREAYLERG
jgi:ATP-dependent DNA helicase RecG